MIKNKYKSKKKDFFKIFLCELEMYYILCYIITIMKELNRQKLRKKIEDCGLTPFAFAQKHGFNDATLRRWLNGERNAKISNIQQLATALRCEIEDITDVVLEFDPAQVVQLEQDRETICGLFGYLNDAQRMSIIQMAEVIADANKKMEEVEI
jgi:transcriptional regulator with XRE-family HTH domain